MSKSLSRRELMAATVNIAAVSTFPFGASVAFAQDAKWPVRSIRLVAPFPAGSITDTVARLLANGLSKSLGQPVIVDNKGGANGSIGVAEVARSAPDGYTLLVTNSSSVTVNPLIYKNSTYKAGDLAPISTVMDAPFILTVNPDWARKNSINTVQDLIGFAQRNPSELNYGSGGTGNLAHLAYAILSNTAKIETVHIPYKAASMASLAVMTGEVNSSFDTLSSLPQIRAGNLKALAVTSPERISQMPDVPTMSQAGFPNFNLTFWIGLLAPNGTPPALIDRLYADAKAAMEVPAAHIALSAQGNVIMQNPKTLAARIALETTKLTEVVKREKISLNS